MTTQFGSPVSGVIEQGGGITRFIAGQDAPPSASPLQQQWEAARVTGATVRSGANPNGSQDEASGFSRYNMADARQAAEQAAVQGGSVAATYDLSNGGTVMVEGMRTSVANAARQGLIQKDGAGRWQDTNRGSLRQAVDAPLANEAPAPLTPPEATPKAASAHFEAAELENFDAAIEPLSQPAYDGALAAATVSILGGASLDAAVTRLARETGGEPAQAHAVVHGVFNMHKATVARAVADVGLEAHELDDYFTWTRSKPNQLHEAIGALMNERTTKHWQAMAREFIGHQTRHGKRQSTN